MIIDSAGWLLHVLIGIWWFLQEDWDQKRFEESVSVEKVGRGVHCM